jgi:hypothetical protein
MVGHRKGPRMIQEILKLRKLGLGKQKIADSLGISKNTVKAYLKAEQSENARSTSQQLPTAPYQAPWSAQVDWAEIKAGVDHGDPLSVLQEEHIEKFGKESSLFTVPYVSFWREFKRRYPYLPLEFHKTHPPGERCEIDFKGSRPGFGYWDTHVGKFIQCEFFGSILCFSQLFYAEATLSQKKAELFKAIHNSFVYFEGVPKLITPDNMKGSVTKADWYDPDLNPDFSNFCEYYGTAAVPARPRRPTDKNLIEGALGIFWRWIRRKFRQKKFYSLSELNAFLRERLEIFNHRIQRKYGLSRRQKFETSERTQLLSLPESPYEICEWSKAKLHWDCHIQVGKYFYSGPYALRSLELDVRITSGYIEIFHQLERVAIHPRFNNQPFGKYATQDQHLPEAHKAIMEFIPQKIIQEAKKIGPHTEDMVSRLILQARHPLMYLRRCQGIIRLNRRYSIQEMEIASEQINRLGETFPKLRDWEALIKSQNARSAEILAIKPIQRGPNPNLRGQAHWTTSDQSTQH